MIIKLGTDIVSVSRIKEVFSERKKLERLFSAKEIEYMDSHESPWETVAGRFAAKEALYKALSPFKISFDFSDVTVITGPNGPFAEFESAEMRELVKDIRLELSISHEQDYAVAFAAAYKE